MDFKLQQNSTDGPPYVSFMASPISQSNTSKLGNLSWKKNQSIEQKKDTV
jgi:hypothetical protein